MYGHKAHVFSIFLQVEPDAEKANGTWSKIGQIGWSMSLICLNLESKNEKSVFDTFSPDA